MFEDDGEIEITKVFSSPSRLLEVRTVPLAHAIRKWAKRTDKASEASGERPSAFRGTTARVAIRPSFGSTYDGALVICLRFRGVPMTAWEKFLVRNSFRFTRLKDGGDNLPTPTNLLEELEDKVIGQIERLAVTGFRTALEEALRYHRFLLDIQNSKDDSGKPLNLSQIGGFWEAPFQEWVRQYRRVIEKAVGKIGIDNYFIESLGNVTVRLLPRDANGIAAPVVESLLDIPVHEVVLLEAWYTRHTTLEVIEGDAAQPKLKLAGSDQRAYEEVILNFVGSWESVLQSTSSMYNWSSEKKKGSSPYWAALTSGWPFIQRHLRNSAYFVASAIWNDDQIGAPRFRDVMVRWFDGLRFYNQNGAYELQHTMLLTPDLLVKNWEDATALLNSLKRFPDGQAASPDAAFNIAVRNAHSDFITLTAAVILKWSTDDDFASSLRDAEARALVQREVIAGEGSRLAAGPPQDNSLAAWSLIIRCAISERGDGANYKAQIDGAVRHLSGMAERRVIPGRIYSGSGFDGFESLQATLLVILAATLPANDDAIVSRFKILADKPELLGDGDFALQRLLYSLRSFERGLTDGFEPDKFAASIGVISNIDPAAIAERLKSIFARIISTIEEARAARLREATVDASKIAELRAKLEEVIGVGHFVLSCFRGFEKVISDQPTDDLSEFTITGIDKADFAVPSMSVQGSSDLNEFLANSFAETVGVRIWRRFWALPRTQVSIDAESASPVFWDAVIESAATVGDRPALLVSNVVGNVVIGWRYGRSAETPPGLEVSIRDDVNSGLGAGYAGTVNGIDVFMANMKDDEACLFSSSMLQTVVHHPLPAQQHLVELDFVAGADVRKSTLVAKYSQKAVWHHRPIVQFATKPPDGGSAISENL